MHGEFGCLSTTLHSNIYEILVAYATVLSKPEYSQGKQGVNCKNLVERQLQITYVDIISQL